MKKLILSFFAFLVSMSAFSVLADDAAKPLQLGLREAATPQMERIISFHNGLLILITVIVIVVTALLAWVLIRYNAKANPKPSKTTHNVPLEIIWTLIPALIVAIIAMPSLKMLYYLDRNDNIEMTLKITGYQWYWGYEYPDHDGISFTSYMIPEDEIDESKGQKRLLSTDNPVVLPIDTNIALQITGDPTDVIHAFTIPAFGVKKDAVPGRMNETWVRIEKPGTYFGQCSEICGKNHAYMPIEIKAVTKEEFEAWLEEAKEEFSMNNNETMTVAYYEGAY
ncbi:MAG: cytochrome c oxidase subunit II [Alphaproteobacteria bacterium]|nr:cytochrome c oxidase subunit II [Alphaproteobacteria bacterium]